MRGRSEADVRSLKDQVSKSEGERELIEKENECLKEEIAEIENLLKQERSEKRTKIKAQKADFIRVLEVAKKEVKRKYGDELSVLRSIVTEFQSRLSEELHQKCKELKKLHLQHQLEKSMLED